MRWLGIGLLTLLLAGSAFAVEPPQNPTFAVIQPQPPQRVDVEIGAAAIHTHAAQIRVAYLPRLAPLPNTFPRNWAEMPNALSLTGVQIPQRPGQRPAYLVIR
jgi:hypothetical protein